MIYDSIKNIQEDYKMILTKNKKGIKTYQWQVDSA